MRRNMLLHDLQVGSNMEQHIVVPVCPPGPCSAVARHLRVHGWQWSDDLLTEVVGQLALQDVCDARALFGLDLHDIDGVEEWPPEVKVFMQKVVCRS